MWLIILLLQRGGVGKIDQNSDGTGEIFNDYTRNVATGKYSTARGHFTESLGDCSISGGYNQLGFIKASGNSSFAMGYAGAGDYDYGYIEASGFSSFAMGSVYNGSIEASGNSSFAMGCGQPGSIHAKNAGSVAMGFSYDNGLMASGIGSIALGVDTCAFNYGQMAVGCCNQEDSNPSANIVNLEKPAFVIGNGNPDTHERSDAFKVLFNGKTFSDGEYSSAGADYAEMFEWEDSNSKNEDRIGRFVTLRGKNIEIAKETDTYILGVVSGAPTIIGDNPLRWKGKYLNDEWGRPIYEDVEYIHKEYEKQEDGTFKQIDKKYIAHIRKLNPLYNTKEKYIPRIERPEWSYVGMMGKILIKQDGTLVEGGFCKSGANGIATASKSGYYVMEVINNNQALILFR